MTESSEQKPRIEIMAPAGSYASLAAAIRSGADSVYFGVGGLDMRSHSAKDFTLRDLRRVARICRWCGVRSYLALNIVLYDEDLPRMREICETALKVGINAVIATDIAAVCYASSLGLEVHTSVQANISNIEAVAYYARYADVVVLARELNLEQIEAIYRQIRERDIRGPSGELVCIELFVHGALCVAIAGKCYMSLAAYNSSANRGACFQSCRRAYRLTDSETGEQFELDNRYVMSPRDLCTIGSLNRLAEAGARIFKIEGRGRSPDYVATTVRVYREARDELLSSGIGKQLDPQRISRWKHDLRAVFNRGFWEGGYYCGSRLGEWSAEGHSQATKKRLFLGRLSNYYSKIGVAELPLEHASLAKGDEILVTGPTTGAVQQKVSELCSEGESSEQAERGCRATFTTLNKVRRRDRVFKLVDREGDHD